MVRLVMYKAKDRKLFYTEEECIKHEKMLDAYNKIEQTLIACGGDPDSRYIDILNEIPEFRDELVKNLGLELVKVELGHNEEYLFKEQDTPEYDAWRRFWTNTVLPF